MINSFITSISLGENDCWDNSDEKDCDGKKNKETCGPDMFRCLNGNCIKFDFICNHEDDCHDSQNLTGYIYAETLRSLSSDEQNCQYHCTTDQFSCENSSMCIPIAWLCDGANDCPDKSDEEKCGNSKKPSLI